eukprot:COSAG01_NODE_1360_length_10569_cov_25.195224_3_plen_96_part_00
MLAVVSVEEGGSRASAVLTLRAELAPVDDEAELLLLLPTAGDAAAAAESRRKNAAMDGEEEAEEQAVTPPWFSFSPSSLPAAAAVGAVPAPVQCS